MIFWKRLNIFHLCNCVIFLRAIMTRVHRTAYKGMLSGGLGSKFLLFCFLSLLSWLAQSTYIPRVPQCMSPRWNWEPPHPSPASVYALPPRLKPLKGGGHIRLRVRGRGEPIPTTGEKHIQLTVTTKIRHGRPGLITLVEGRPMPSPRPQLSHLRGGGGVHLFLS